MRILIDATAVGDGRGGIVTYLLGLLRGWNEAGFGDEIVVIGTSKLPNAIDAALGDRGTILRLGRKIPGSRQVVQHVGIPIFAHRWKPDVVLATTPVVPLFISGPPITVVVHDLRYLRRPSEFGRAQRRYRSVMYRRGIERAHCVLTNSHSTERDTVAAFPEVADKIVTVYLGCDRFETVLKCPTPGSHALAYAHWTNKQPDVAIKAWSALKSKQKGFCNQLHVVGVSDGERDRLKVLAERSAVQDLVQFHDYLDEESYQCLFSSAALVFMPSTFEGFGLPIVEAMRLRIPVVASDDAGMREAGGEFALYAPANSPEAFASQCARVLFDHELRESLIEGGFQHVQKFTWRKTAEQTRQTLSNSLITAKVIS